ncbi:GrpE -like protein 1, mitochondrial [Halotydeus destructor]|nr:GrpE -like protein 1, mitochondrial [Halotydeus destructor]
MSTTFNVQLARQQPIFFKSKSEEATEKSPNEQPPPAVDETSQQSADSSGINQENQISEAEKALKEEAAQLLERVKEIDDKYKRALAENENTRIRMRKQIDDAKIYGIQSFCKDILDVADVLSTAIQTVDKEAVHKNELLKNLFDGVQMTEQQLQGVFRRHGLVKIDPIGEKFNPNEHHAMFETVEEGKEPGTVANVVKIGYKLHSRTIRPAMVGVVKKSS